MEPLAPSDPARIASYELLARLGAGGMGLVYLARSPGGRLVAVKVIHTHLTDDPDFLRRFRREVAAARAVSGFYTAPVVDADTGSRPAWLATAHVAGPDLAAVVTARGPLPGHMVTALAAALAEALRAVHAAGLVHRDLKPSNILLAEDGPRVIDFGIARAVDGTETIGGLVGTPGYMSPEQAEGGEAGPASDVFSLGGVLYFAATGRPPFGAGDLRVVLHRVMSQEPDLAGVPAPQRDLIARCLAKQPSTRPSPDEMLAELAGPVARTGLVDWAAEPYGTMIEEHATDALARTGAQEADPERAPEPASEPAQELGREPGPEPEQRTESALDPEPEPVAPPALRREKTSRSSWPRRRSLIVPAVVVLVIVLVFVVLDLGDSGTGDGFQPWSVDDVFGSPVVAGGVVFIGTTNGSAAYDARTGEQRWTSPTGEKEAAIGRYGDVLIVRDAARLRALDPRSGRRLWQMPLSEDGSVAPPGSSDDIVVTDRVDEEDGLDQVVVSAIDSGTGVRLRRQSLNGALSMSYSDGRVSTFTRGKDEGEGSYDTLVSLAPGSGEIWRVSAEVGEIVTADDGNVYTADSGDDAHIIRAYAANGRPRWDVRLPTPEDSDDPNEVEIALTGSTLCVLVDDGFYAFDTADGSRRSAYSLPDRDRLGEFSVVGDTAYVWWDASDRGILRTVERTVMSVIDVRTGRRLWNKRTDSDAGFVWVDDRTAYVGSFKKLRFRPDDNELIAFDGRTGQERWRRGTDRRGVVVPWSGILYVRDGDKLEAIDAATGDGP